MNIHFLSYPCCPQHSWYYQMKSLQKSYLKIYLVGNHSTLNHTIPNTWSMDLNETTLLSFHWTNKTLLIVWNFRRDVPPWDDLCRFIIWAFHPVWFLLMVPQAIILYISCKSTNRTSAEYQSSIDISLIPFGSLAFPLKTMKSTTAFLAVSKCHASTVIDTFIEFFHHKRPGDRLNFSQI